MDALVLIKKEQVLAQFGSAISKKPTANKWQTQSFDISFHSEATVLILLGLNNKQLIKAM